ncbi:mycofactocin biosynthesis peptidyl-dipeptidase MftE [Tomitella fengzijianii]|uniref:Mycofactocin biosynthesis peptidyl-dipeptidase MftE n=1 Tax=Tomitella fengzijianii TaxID=2597660 RepID=A0A516X1I1_9ACTN|nr:mycofactocin biosynthesis peptidyl-dipeptidase MftE [Tomitella fengzijianii]QDQ96942.1 mycofactocin biosynthesis peptidyl-dipeptidase MftE [Tomitella fengzijianii]
MNLAESAWPEAAADLLVVPVGSMEQHGPHLPLDTDTRIATAVAASLGRVVAPAIAYGASGEHEQFPGTVSIGSEALRLLLVEYGRSACRWAPRIVFVNGHGGNASALASAVKLLRYEGRDAAWWTPVIQDGDAHAGRTETAMMLHLAPGSVRMGAAAPGNTAPAGDLWQAIREGGVAAVSGSGVLGDPTAATAEEGRRTVETLCAELQAAVDGWSPDGHGRIAA